MRNQGPYSPPHIWRESLLKFMSNSIKSLIRNHSDSFEMRVVLIRLPSSDVSNSSPLIPLPPTHSTEFASSHFIIKIYGKKVKSLCKSIEFMSNSIICPDPLIRNHSDFKRTIVLIELDINLSKVSRQMCGEKGPVQRSVRLRTCATFHINITRPYGAP